RQGEVDGRGLAGGDHHVGAAVRPVTQELDLDLVRTGRDVADSELAFGVGQAAQAGGRDRDVRERKCVSRLLVGDFAHDGATLLCGDGAGETDDEGKSEEG